MSTNHQTTQVLGDCPLCRRAAYGSQVAANMRHTITCVHCGCFTITDAACVLLQSLPQRFWVAMSRAVRAAEQAGHTLHIEVQDIARLAAPYL